MQPIQKPGGGDSRIKQIASSAGRLWTQTREQLTAIMDGELRKVRTSPLSYKKVVVFFGSSSTEGSGTTNKETKPYHKLLAAKLAGGDYIFYGRGIGGDNTTGAIARFYNDIAPINADFVVLAFTLGNEGLYTATTAAGKMDVYKKFKAGILKLCHMVQQQGAVPIVMTQAPTNSYTTEIYDYAAKLNAELETIGIHCCDWGGVVDAMDGTGKPISSIMSADGLHYVDSAHVEIANSIPPTLFDKANLQQGGLLPILGGAINTGSLVSATPISYSPTDVTTFTASVRFRASTIILAAIMSFNDLDRIVLQADGRITLQNATVNDEIVPAGTIKAGEWNTVTVTYSPLTKEARTYVNGVFKKATTMTIAVSKWTLGGRGGTSATLKNTDLKNAVLYRTRLTDQKIKQLYEGVIPQTSLEIYSPFHDKVVSGNNNLINLAATSVNLVVDPTETALTTVSSA